jgi:cysteine desulfurase
MIYADHNATTPPLPEVVAAVTACLRDGWGNPGSRQHPFGRRAQAALDTAREQVAGLVGGRADEIIFTSGATEALSLALYGLGGRLLATQPRIVTCATEHPAVLEPLARLAEAGAEIKLLPVDGDGRLDPTRLEAAIDGHTGLVALMLANHETGVVHDLAAAAAVAHRQGALLLCDAVQTLGKLPVAVDQLGCDALVGTGHKFYGPPGAGFLWLRRGLGLDAQLRGGGQERGRRAGTPDLPAIAGLGVAAEMAARDQAARATHLAALTGRFEAAARATIPGLVIAGAAAPRAPGTSLCVVPGLRQGWLAALGGVAASAGATCAGGDGSPVLRAMGFAATDAANAIRLSFGIGTTVADVDRIIQELARAVESLVRSSGRPVVRSSSDDQT